MAKSLKIRDLTLRDGQQSSFATRMNQAQIDRCLPFYKDANFYAMEVWGGAVPDSVMRYLNENPWTRLETIHKAIGNVSKLTALSRGRNLFGYAPYTDEIIDGFCRNSIQSGLGIMRIFDALNDVNNVKSTVKYVKQYGGIADCAVCYTVDPKYPEIGFFGKLMGKKNPKPVFTDEYFLSKAKQMEALGADMITIKDMSGLIPPHRVYVFCKKLGIDTGVNMEAVAKINTQLKEIRKELEISVFGKEKPMPKPFNPLTDELPKEIDAEFDRAIKAAQADDEETLLDACHKIEAHFGFPAPNELVKKAEIPGGMYSNMVAQLQQLKAEEILPRAMELIPTVRLAAGLPPLVTPTSQIVGAQAVSCALDEKAGRPMYTTKSSQFVALVKGEYGETPVKIDPEFRFKICGVREEIPYDTSKYQMQPNPELPEAGGVKLAANEKEVLLLELFPMVAKTFLTDQKKKAYEATAAKDTPKTAARSEHKVEAKAITGHKVTAPLPGKIIALKVKVGDKVKAGQEVVILEAMKMENSITSDVAGTIKQILVQEGDNVATDAILVEVEE